jgi:hypothetical protein
MLNRFFFTLRDAGIPVTVTEYLALPQRSMRVSRWTTWTGSTTLRALRW